MTVQNRTHNYHCNRDAVFCDVRTKFLNITYVHLFSGINNNINSSNNNTGDWNHFKITQTIPERHTRKALN